MAVAADDLDSDIRADVQNSRSKDECRLTSPGYLQMADRDHRTVKHTLQPSTSRHPLNNRGQD